MNDAIEEDNIMINKKSNKRKKQYFEFTEVFVWGDDTYGQLGLYH